MRNLFDQYTQPENKLTHALAVCLNEDRALLRQFLRWLDVKPPTDSRNLVVVEQSLPGDPPESEDEAERRGLPDIVIHDDNGWCLLVESKVMAALTVDQLRRHERTLARRGFDQVHRLALTRREVTPPRGVIARTWALLYDWLGRAAQRGEWPERLRSYLRAAEVRLVHEGYLEEGTLTVFDGFPFSNKNPYTYGEAKRLLKIARSELTQNRRLQALGMDRRAAGRGAITGRDGTGVWDFLSLKERAKSRPFTAYPHLTLGVQFDHLEVAITIPNGVIRTVRKRLANLGADGMIAMNAEILRRAKPLIARGASVVAVAHQRHYLGQRSRGITDAMLNFRLETSQARSTDRVKPQREWVEVFTALTRQKQANIQFQYRINFPWGTKGLDTRESLELIVDSWVALKPLLDSLRSDRRVNN